MDDDRADIVERHPADLDPLLRDDQEAAMGGQMPVVGGDIDDPFQTHRGGVPRQSTGAARGRVRRTVLRAGTPRSRTRTSSSIRSWRARQPFSVLGEG